MGVQEKGEAEAPAWFRFPETALTVIMKAIEAGDEARLNLWLCPVLAHTPEQQAEFRTIYERLFISSLEAPEKEKEAPEKGKGGYDKLDESLKAPEKSARPLPFETESGEQKVVASLKSRSTGACVLDRFVRSAEMASDPVLLRVVRQLRFTRESGRNEFDVRQTVRRATRRGGYALPAFSPRRHHVEYLMLIDRHNERDHRAHLHNSLYETLRENNIFVERFWFDHSPLICRNDRHPSGIAIGELLSLYCHAVLLLFADGLQFIDTWRLEIFPWASVFRHWEHRYFVSSVPPVLWGRRESLLRELFPEQLPLSTDALRMLADDLDENDGNGIDRVRYWQEGADYSLVPLCASRGSGSMRSPSFSAAPCSDGLPPVRSTPN
ncbi:MAG: hypothetical protein HGA97_12965 [Chlorobiaceae bacterium]|nr:hypothetical protein [Chlorobiaceae bacterium]